MLFNALCSVAHFFNQKLPWWLSSILGCLLMIIPPCIAAAKGFTSLEPGFNYGVFYGLGLAWSCAGLTEWYDSLSAKKKNS